MEKVTLKKSETNILTMLAQYYRAAMFKHNDERRQGIRSADYPTEDLLFHLHMDVYQPSYVKIADKLVGLGFAMKETKWRVSRYIITQAGFQQLGEEMPVEIDIPVAAFKQNDVVQYVASGRYYHIASRYFNVEKNEWEYTLKDARCYHSSVLESKLMRWSAYRIEGSNHIEGDESL